MLSEAELQDLFRQCFVLAGDREGAFELLYDGAKELARRHPKGLKQVFPFSYRFFEEFAAQRGLRADAGRTHDGEPVLAPEGAVDPLSEEEIARIEGVMAGFSTRSTLSIGEDDDPLARIRRGEPWYNRLGKPWQRGLVAAAAILLLLLIPSRNSKIATPERAMEELERIYLESTPPDFPGPTVQAAASAVPGISFKPVEPQVVELGPPWKVEGASRCHFRGEKECVIVTLTDAGTEERYSLIELPLPTGFATDDLSGGVGLEGERKGVVVRMWEENGILIGWVGPVRRGAEE